jgi:hypothetical protein
MSWGPNVNFPASRTATLCIKVADVVLQETFDLNGYPDRRSSRRSVGSDLRVPIVPLRSLREMRYRIASLFPVQVVP